MEGILVQVIKGIFLVAAALMTFFILLQEGKGGDITSFGGTRASEIVGTSNPIRRATTVLAIVFFVMAVLLGILAR